MPYIIMYNKYRSRDYIGDWMNYRNNIIPTS